MNIKSDLKIAFVHFIIACSVSACSSCANPGGQSHALQNGPCVKLLDTLKIQIDTNGRDALIQVFDAGGDENRIVQIELPNDELKALTFRNDQLVPCSTCGRQSSDPFFMIRQNKNIPNAFDLRLDRQTQTFIVNPSNVLLQKIDVLHVSPGEDRYLEWHEIYTPEDFGKVHFTEVTEDLIFRLRDSIITRKLKRFYSRQKH